MTITHDLSPDAKKCIDCAKCMNPENKPQVYFKYPNAVKSGYKSFFKDIKLQARTQNFDYDKIRDKIRKNEGIEGL
jgi:hypothetical protein